MRLSLRPPQVLSAHSVAPDVAITAVLSLHSLDDAVLYATRERKKFNLCLSTGRSREVRDEIKALYSLEDMVVAVYSGGSLEAFKLEDMSTVWLDDTHVGSRVVFSALVDVKDTTTVVIVAHAHSTPKATVQTVAFESSGSRFLLESALDMPEGEVQFAYDSGMLYQANGSCVTSFKLLGAVKVGQVEINGIITGILALPHNNIVVAAEERLMLLDCTYQAEIASVKLDAPGRLLSYSSMPSIIIAEIGSEVVGLNVKPTKGTLLESVGKGLPVANQYQYGMASIFGPSVRDFRRTAQAQIAASQDNLQRILMDLDSGVDLTRVINYLKGAADWSECVPTTSDPVYEDSDRVVDSALIAELAIRVFGSRSSLKRSRENVALYLLSHPLFPTERIPHLVQRLRHYPRLYRQAIVTLPGINASDLLLALLDSNVDIFLDSVVRLVAEFSSTQIVEGVRSGFAELRSLNSLTPLIERLSMHRQAWPLVGPFIDAVGLLGWDPESLQRVQQRLSSEIDRVQEAVGADVALEDLLTSVGIDTAVADTVAEKGPGDFRRKQRRKPTSSQVERHVPRYSVETMILQ